jgi:DNA-binding FadR family transcriptional regulator
VTLTDPADSPDSPRIQVTDALAARINAGEFSGKPPAERRLACDYGVACQAVHALAVLRDLGLITGGQLPHPPG